MYVHTYVHICNLVRGNIYVSSIGILFLHKRSVIQRPTGNFSSQKTSNQKHRENQPTQVILDSFFYFLFLIFLLCFTQNVVEKTLSYTLRE
jgi:hypothetical protein